MYMYINEVMYMYKMYMYTCTCVCVPDMGQSTLVFVLKCKLSAY